MTALDWQILADAIADHDEISAAPLLKLYRSEHPAQDPHSAFWEGTHLGQKA